MRLTDIVQHADLALWPQIAMVLFMFAFVLVGLRVVLTSREQDRAMARAAIEDDVPAKPASASQGADAAQILHETTATKERDHG
ncbi:MAG: hypothetical protein AAF138_00765 [Planctomycetota bacterium]